MGNEILSSSRGLGVWEFEIYNPQKKLEPIEGYLVVSKDNHIVFEFENYTKTLLNIPSQNVAYVLRLK